MTPGAPRRGVRTRLRPLVKPSVLGAFDGVVTVLGILFALSAAPHELRQSALGLAASGAVSMGGAQFLADNEAGWWASAAMGLTTGLGTLVPAAPYLVWQGGGGVAAGVSVALCLAAAGVVSWLKTTDGRGLSLRRSAVQTYALLLVAGAFTLLCAWVTGAVG